MAEFPSTKRRTVWSVTSCSPSNERRSSDAHAAAMKLKAAWSTRESLRQQKPLSTMFPDNILVQIIPCVSQVQAADSPKNRAQKWSYCCAGTDDGLTFTYVQLLDIRKGELRYCVGGSMAAL